MTLHETLDKYNGKEVIHLKLGDAECFPISKSEIEVAFPDEILSLNVTDIQYANLLNTMFATIQVGV